MRAAEGSSEGGRQAMLHPWPEMSGWWHLQAAHRPTLSLFWRVSGMRGVRDDMHEGRGMTCVGGEDFM